MTLEARILEEIEFFTKDDFASRLTWNQDVEAYVKRWERFKILLEIYAARCKSNRNNIYCQKDGSIALERGKQLIEERLRGYE